MGINWILYSIFVKATNNDEKAGVYESFIKLSEDF